jgi:D-alanyl-D-alanine carboxypeptidase (penicillin-binding protein 5/6)
MFKEKLVAKIAAILLMPLVFTSGMTSVFAENAGGEAPDALTFAEGNAVATVATVKDTLALDCKSAILMEAATGAVLYEQNADEALPPASVTKIMTLLLVMEAIDEGKIKLDDTVTASERAASMGGSQIFLKVGEQMSVEDMIKSVVISSANDAACALAEFVSGSEEAFVRAMNVRAAELGMKNTSFENTNGLDDTAENHLTSARDIAIMSRELIKHKKILEYSSIWMDSVRNGAFGLTNTNRLVRFYRGCTGLKTGSTSKAGFCVSATAERDGMSLICVIMGSESRDIRNAQATKLLDWGFANYALYSHEGEKVEGIRLIGGVRDSVVGEYGGVFFVCEKGNASEIQSEIALPDYVSAPVKRGDGIGEVVFTCDGKEIGRTPIRAAEDIDKISFLGLWYRILAKFALK